MLIILIILFSVNFISKSTFLFIFLNFFFLFLLSLNIFFFFFSFLSVIPFSLSVHFDVCSSSSSFFDCCYFYFFVRHLLLLFRYHYLLRFLCHLCLFSLLHDRNFPTPHLQIFANCQTITGM